MSTGIPDVIGTPAAGTRASCERRREEILDAATSLFAEHGFSDAVTQLLADKLQVGKGTIYRHFASKRELFLAATDRVMRRVYDRVEEAIRGVEDPLERIRAGVTTFLDFFDRHPEFVELLVQERAYFKDRPEPTFFEHRARSVERWRNLYRTLIGEGRVREMPVERITDVMSAALYGAIFLRYYFGGGGDGGGKAAGADDILDVVFAGILSDSERARPRAARPPDRPADD